MIRSFNFWNISALVAANVAIHFVHGPTCLWICLAQAAFVGGMLLGRDALERP